MDIKENWMKLVLSTSIKLRSIISSIVNLPSFIDFGLFCSCLVAPASLPFKIAVGGFIGGNLIFVAPLYYMAIQGTNNYITKIMRLGGMCMLISWLSLIFA